mmetsp:Transcript_1677/g.3481  ORF Transcript_1677/g.3481 Transcript_1677/m.3481 type:complete len:86 (-) Transcript_1677:125-382(-)
MPCPPLPEEKGMAPHLPVSSLLVHTLHKPGERKVQKMAGCGVVEGSTAGTELPAGGEAHTLGGVLEGEALLAGAIAQLEEAHCCR